jgi:hypothetical protein
MKLVWVTMRKKRSKNKSLKDKIPFPPPEEIPPRKIGRGSRYGELEQTEKQKKYAKFRIANPDKPKKAARDYAGYSEGTSVTAVESKTGTKYAMASVERQRETLQTDPDYSFEGVARRLVTRAKDEDVPAGVQTDNDKVLVGMMGYSAPTQVHTKSLGLMLEFNDLTGADLAALKEGLLPEKVE